MAREVVPAGVRATAQWSVGGGGGRGRGAGGEGAVSGGCEIDPFILHNSDESCLTPQVNITPLIIYAYSS